jgi:hypothetical protein
VSATGLRAGLAVAPILAAWLAAFVASPAAAEIVRQVRIESVPSGAEVFLLQGGKRTLLGSTPVRPQLEFHSEVSVLRVSVSKSGFQTETAEVGAQQAELTVQLRPRRVAALPNEIGNEALRAIQGRIYRRIEEVVARSLASAPREWEIAGLVRVVDLDGKTYLVAPVSVNKAPAVESSAAASEVWRKVGTSLVQPLGEIARAESKIQGIVVSVVFGEIRREFAASGQVETRVEMQCVPGTEIVQEYDPCARQEEQMDGSRRTGLYRCVSGTVTRSRFNPCLTKTPVTKTSVTVKPQATSRGERSKLQFVVPAAALGDLAGRREILPQIGVLRADAQGRVLERRGPVPSALPTIP